MSDPLLNLQFTATESYNRSLEGRATKLVLISSGSATVVVDGSIATGAPLLELFSDTVVNSAVSTVDVSGVDEIQISVDGDPIWGRIY